MIDFDYLAITISAFVYFIMILVVKIKLKKDFAYIFIISLFYYYVINVIRLTIFPIPVDSEYLEIIRAGTNFYNNVNFEPLWSSEYFVFIEREHILNIVLTMPLGFFTNYFFNLNLRKVLTIAVLSGIVIESSQLLVSLIINYPYRSMDINDLIFNFVGVVLGYIFFKCFSYILIKMVEHFNIQLNSLTQFLYWNAKKASKKNAKLEHENIKQ